MVVPGLILASAARFVRDDIDAIRTESVLHAAAAAAQSHDVNRPNVAGLAADTLGGYGRRMAGYEMSKDDLLARLRRIEGQVRGIARMIEEDKYCIDVLTQVSAATKGLQQVGLGLFDDHLRHCVADAVAAGGPEANRKLAEATAAVERLVKS